MPSRAEERRPALAVKELGAYSRWTPRSRRGRHVETERAVKARNQSWVAEAVTHSEGRAYKLRRSEIALCPRVGRMGPDK